MLGAAEVVPKLAWEPSGAHVKVRYYLSLKAVSPTIPMKIVMVRWMKTKTQMAMDTAAAMVIAATALKNAVSVALTIMSADCVISNVRINEGS